MIALIAVSAFAQESDAPRFGVMAEIGSIRNADQNYALFADTNGMFGGGARLAYRPASHLELRLGYQLARHGATVYSANSGYSDFTSAIDSIFESAFFGHTMTVGARVDASIEGMLLPYAALDAVGLLADVRFDDDPSARDNPGQVTAMGFAPGAGLVGGLELRVPPQSDVQVGLHLELGYTYLAPMDLADFGTMQAGGFTVRSGLGLRF